LYSLEEVVATNDETGGEICLLHDVLASDQEDPGTKAARKMDWETMMQALSPREQIVINQPTRTHHSHFHSSQHILL